GPHPHLRIVDEFGRASVVALHSMPDLVLDLTGVLVLTSRITHRDDHREHTVVDSTAGRGEVARKGGDAASAWGIRPDKSDRQTGVSSVQQGGAFLPRRSHRRHLKSTLLLLP